MTELQRLHYIITHEGHCPGGGCVKCSLRYIPCTFGRDHSYDLGEQRIIYAKQYLTEYTPEDLLEVLL